jgi:hypothetical protein
MATKTASDLASYAQENWKDQVRRLMKQSDYRQALARLQTAECLENPEALNYLSWFYLFGVATKENPEQGINLLCKSRERGYRNASVNYALLSQKGIALEKDERSAFDILIELANSGNTAAMKRLCQAYASGLGTERNLDRFSYWSERYSNEFDPKYDSTFKMVASAAQAKNHVPKMWLQLTVSFLVTYIAFLGIFPHIPGFDCLGDWHSLLILPALMFLGVILTWFLGSIGLIAWALVLTLGFVLVSYSLRAGHSLDNLNQKLKTISFKLRGMDFAKKFPWVTFTIGMAISVCASAVALRLISDFFPNWVQISWPATWMAASMFALFMRINLQLTKNKKQGDSTATKHEAMMEWCF